MKTGLVLGKFYPPHKGHLYLINRAQYDCEQVIVVVGSMPDQKPSGALRTKWLKRLVGHNTIVLEVPDDNPEGVTAEDELYWTMWRDNLLAHIPYKPRCIYGSDDYIITLSKYMDMSYKLVDQEREHVPISATQIRLNPKKYWEYIPEVVRPYYENLLNN